MMRDYSILPMLQRRMAKACAARAPFPTDPEELMAHLAMLRGKLLECMGTRPPEVLEPEVQVEASFELEGTGVIQERLVYRTEEDVWVPAHLYRPARPRAERLPGVLLIQGWDLDKHSMPDFKVRLAAAGYVVLFPDNRFSGERRHATDGQVEIGRAHV